MNKSPKTPPPAGQIRQSQILSTFGPGSMVDLTKHSVLISGLNYWRGNRKPILEERLAARVAAILGVDSIKLCTPPIEDRSSPTKTIGITAFIFPNWFLAQIDTEGTWTDEKTKKIYRTRVMVGSGDLENGKYKYKDGKKYPVVPVRFVQSCVNGHISDIDWDNFVHEKGTKCHPKNLWLDEGGSGNDFTEIYVRCGNCQKRTSLSLAKNHSKTLGSKILGPCQGHHLWLGENPKNHKFSCTRKSGETEYNRLLVRSASNAYFSQILSVISLPDAKSELQNQVNSVYEDFLQYAEDIDDIKKERKKAKVKSALEKFSDEIVWEEVQRRKNRQPEAYRSIKLVEIETLLATEEALGEDIPESEFYATSRNLEQLPPNYSSVVEKIVLVHRLREVIALVGFTRFEPEMPDIDGELDINVRRAPLGSKSEDWVPAIENKGEGVFIAFSKEKIEQWSEREAVKKRGHQLSRGFDTWCASKDIDQEKENIKFPGLPYIMLHSLSHLLIMTVSLECGYAASSIRERIYANEGGYGILLYTASSSSEGTLGGLVEVGKNIEHHLHLALDRGRLCSNDPVCAQHQPQSEAEERFLHGAACHGCLLIAESSCERRNEFLDRALVIPTLEALGVEFFSF